MTKTLKERAEYAIKYLDVDCYVPTDAFISRKEVEQIIKEQQAYIEQLEARTKWRDIESAPKDKEVLILCGNDVCTARYRISNCVQDKPFFATTANGDFKNIGTDWKQEYEYIPATHWMPLPEPEGV